MPIEDNEMEELRQHEVDNAYQNRAANRFGKTKYFVGNTKVKIKKGHNKKNLNESLSKLISDLSYYYNNDNGNYIPSVKRKTDGQKVKIKQRRWLNGLKDRLVFGNNEESVATEQEQRQSLLQTKTDQQQSQAQSQPQTDNTTTSNVETSDASSGQQNLMGFQNSEDVLDNKENKSIGRDFSKLVTNGVLSNIAEKGGKMNYIIYFQPGGKTEYDYSTWEQLKRARNNVKYGHPELTEGDRKMVKLGNETIAPIGAALLGAGFLCPSLLSKVRPKKLRSSPLFYEDDQHDEDMK